VIAAVARASKRSVAEVGADSYALTLWAHLHAQDSEHLDALVDEKNRLEMADLTALAHWEPKRIAGERLRWKAKIGGLESREDVAKRAHELLERSARQRGELPS
jgi:hypothetical protein